MKFPFTRNLPADLTSYDFFKSFAVIMMVIDHIGMYIYPDQMEWRVIGRMSMPVWLFLIGYARSRDLSPSLWIGGTILVLSNIVVGESVFSLNILFTILVARMVIDKLATAYLKGAESALFTYVVLVLLVVPTCIAFDYGTFAFLFAMLGYFIRDKNSDISNLTKYSFMLIAAITHTAFEAFCFAFSFIEAGILLVEMLIVCYALTLFTSKNYPKLSENMPFPLVWFFQLMGRYSLEIYVIHLIILKAIAFYLYPEVYGLFHFKWL